VTVGFSAQVSVQLGISTVQETITVTGESPTSIKRSRDEADLHQRAAAEHPVGPRPWVILQQTAGIAMDRENVGGNMSGQQSARVRGGQPFNNKWSLDGGTSPHGGDWPVADLLRFRHVQEMTVNTGGSTWQQTGGGHQPVTKSGLTASGDRHASRHGQES
jgi:hypothetical protein